MKTITLTVTDEAKITVDGVEYAPKELDAPKPERELWTPMEDDDVFVLWGDGSIGEHKYLQINHITGMSIIFPTREHAEAAKRHREAQSVIDRYCYAKGVDTRWKESVNQWSCCWRNNKLESIFTTYVHGSPFHVESKEIAEQIIADCGDEIRTVLLRGWTE